MKLRTLLLSALASGLFLCSSSSYASTETVDLDSFKLVGRDRGQTVEVNLNAVVLGVAARIAECQDAEAGKLMRGLSRVQVRVVQLDETGVDAALTQIEAVRAQLNRAGWQKMVSVRQAKGDNVDVHVAIGKDEMINGIVVSVLNGKAEAVLVNVVGEIRPEQLAELGARLNIEPLKKLKLKNALVDEGAQTAQQ